jgi:hypothetical protein
MNKVIGLKDRVASQPCTRPVFRKPAFLKKFWPRKIAGLVTGLEWLGGFERVKRYRKKIFHKPIIFTAVKVLWQTFLIG